MNNESGLHPVGHCLLILLDDPDESHGLLAKTSERLEADRLAMTSATVLEIGTECWKDETQPRCKVGDKIVFRLYAGEMKTGLDGKKVRIIDDRSVYCLKD